MARLYPITLSLHPPDYARPLAEYLLAHHLREALANFTWINNVTSGACGCSFVYDRSFHCLARASNLPFTAISLEGYDADTTALLLAHLLRMGEEAYALVPRRLYDLLAASCEVLSVRREWQMLYRGGRGETAGQDVRALTAHDLPAMLDLAHRGGLMVFGPSSLKRGEFFGIEREGRLVCMGGVQNRLPGAVEIGSIVTHPDFRRRGLATRLVTALVG
ncbi:MAG: GNAT family N-acetyltransferase, partial [Caldilineae bacterium]